MRPSAWSAVAWALAVLVAACGGGGDAELASGPAPAATTTSMLADGSAPPTSDAGPGASVPGSGSGSGPTGSAGSAAPAATNPPPRPSELAGVKVRLTRLVGVEQPLAIAFRQGDGAMYVAEKTGRVRAVRNGQVDSVPVLDLAGGVSSGTEQGLLGLVFSPDGGRLFVNYTDTEGDTRIVEYAMAGGQVNPDSRRELLFVDQPYANHNGGHLAFGPDGRLWIGLGDGGGGGDPANNAQSLGTLLGKMLRIDPQPGVGSPYTVPSDNPFFNTAGARPEIWAYGLRNPWRYSFDRATGDLWIGDVGQNAREEIDFQPAGRGGQNYGWARMEGTQSYSGTPPANAVGPIFDYARTGGNCSVTGGYVYRGNRIPGLAGAYVFADYCVGQVRALVQRGGQVVDERSFSASAKFLTSFGQDAAGELYAASLDGGVFRLDPA